MSCLPFLTSLPWNTGKYASNLGFYAQSTRMVISGRRRDGAGEIVQELCESRGGRPGLSVLTSLLVSVDVKIY